jgi:hypothetical protein
MAVDWLRSRPDAGDDHPLNVRELLFTWSPRFEASGRAAGPDATQYTDRCGTITVTPCNMVPCHRSM